LTIYTKAQESSLPAKYTSNNFLLNCSFGIGTFAAGENVGGSAFVGSRLLIVFIKSAKKFFRIGFVLSISKESLGMNIDQGE
jgi:hypothetical protein